MATKNLLLDTLANKLNDLGYSITYNDIKSDEKNVIGMYLRDAGKGIATLGGNNISLVDLSIRLHGDVVSGSQEKCYTDLATIESRLSIANKEFTGIRIIGSTLRGSGVMLGKTSEGIPVYNISFLVYFN